MRSVALLAVAFLAAACANVPKRLEPVPSVTEPYDPLEGYNRRALAANRIVDDLYIKPAASFYAFVLPGPVRRSLANFTNNLLVPDHILNDILQADFRDAGHNTARLAINSTVGVGGLFDPATRWGFEERQEDLGQTLGNWGVPQGPYFVAPFVGPTTARGILGSLAKLGISPATNVYLPEDIGFRAGMVGQRTAERRITSDETLTDVYTRPDGYIVLRSLYLQDAAAELHEDGDPYANLPDF